MVTVSGAFPVRGSTIMSKTPNEGSVQLHTLEVVICQCADFKAVISLDETVETKVLIAMLFATGFINLPDATFFNAT